MSITNLLVISDTHLGCQHGLCSPDGHRMDDGGRYFPSPNQRVLCRWWETMVGEWLPWATKGEPFALCVNGDAIDGVHHNSVTQWTHNITTQAEAARDVIGPLAERASALYWVRGTEAHVGKSGQDEERLARDLGAVQNDSGQYAAYQLRIMVGDALVDCQHHIGIAGSVAYETTALTKEMNEAYADSARWGQDPPQVMVRSHRHRCAKVVLPSAKGDTLCIVTPAWQLRTPFSYRVLGGRTITPHIGAVLVRWANGEIFTREFVRTISPPKPVV